ncbi:MAG: hypothetical protein ACOC87_03740 [Candidatus Natronoplasma sp.]
MFWENICFPNIDGIFKKIPVDNEDKRRKFFLGIANDVWWKNQAVLAEDFNQFSAEDHYLVDV